MLQVLWTPFASPITEVFKEYVCGTVGEDERTLDKFCRWAPLTAWGLWTDIPRLLIVSD